VLALVVDNDRFFRDLLKEILGDLGYAVTTAADGLEALEAVMQKPPDIIFLDLVMPKIGGDRVCAYLKSDPATSTIPIVILSATVAEDQTRIMAMGADACIAKGPAEELRAHIKTAIDRLAKGVRSPEPGPGVFGVERAHPRGTVVELLASKRHHEAILAEIAEGVIEADALGKVIYINPAALRLLARSEREVIGQELPGLFDAATANELRAGLKRDGRPLDLSLTAGERMLVLRAGALGDQDSDGGWLVVLQDQTELWQKITELSVLNQQLRALDRLKSEFLSMVSHDLKTPLTSICCSLDLLGDPRLSKESREEVLDVAKQNAGRLGQLVSDLLDSARIEAGKLELHRAFLPVDDALRRAAEKFRTVVRERGLQLQVEILGKTPPPVWADAGRLEQILGNLLSNAIKALEPGGRITLKARTALSEDVGPVAAGASADFLGTELIVEDDGPGIPSEHLPHVFEKFYRAGGGEGAGLGLYICRALVEEHGGRIVAESAPEKGTRIRFWLPARVISEAGG
jgi:two-component system sensor histidine kinase ResE